MTRTGMVLLLAVISGCANQNSVKKQGRTSDTPSNIRGIYLEPESKDSGKPSEIYGIYLESFSKDSGAFTATSHCDLFFSDPDNIKGVCFDRTDGEGHRVKMSSRDVEIIKSQLR